MNKYIPMKKYMVIAVMIIAATVAKAQQDAHYSLYMFNGLYLNPAYAGSHEVVDLMAIYRHQWAGIDGAPQTGNLSVHGALRRNQYGLGLTVFGEHIGLTTAINATGSFAYRIKVRKSKICLGVQAGATYYRQNNTGAIPAELQAQGYYDQNYAINRSMVVPNFGAGIYVYGKRYYVGFSVPHILPVTISKKLELNTTNGVARQYNHYILTAGVVIGKETSPVKFRPSFLAKYIQGLDRNIPDFDVSAALLFVDRFWLGGTFRVASGLDNKKGTAVVGWFECKITQRLRVGYGFDYSLNKLNNFAKYGSHDIMLGYEFNTGKKRFVSPRYVSYF